MTWFHRALIDPALPGNLINHAWIEVHANKLCDFVSCPSSCSASSPINTLKYAHWGCLDQRGKPVEIRVIAAHAQLKRPCPE